MISYVLGQLGELKDAPPTPREAILGNTKESVGSRG